MWNLKITDIPLIGIPTENQVIDISYRQSGTTGAFVSAGTITVNSGGSIVSIPNPFIIAGLNESWSGIEVQAINHCNGLSFSKTFMKGVVPFTFYFGFGAVPTDEEGIEAGTSGTANPGEKAVVPDFGNTTDNILWYAEPLTEPAKTIWFNTVTNNGNIGDEELFSTPVTIGGYRLYATSYATTFSSHSSVEFRI